MSMLHKAFAFDWSAFVADDLYRLILEAPSSRDTRSIAEYIDTNLDDIKDPYEGEPLPEDWRAMLESGDVHELADYALTKFYDPLEDAGICDQWRTLHEALSAHDQAALLGTPLESEDTCFDPGRQGSYFQTPMQVEESLNRIRRFDLSTLRDEHRESLDQFKRLLADCVESHHGLYVTF